jgi:hypothetical protein
VRGLGANCVIHARRGDGTRAFAIGIIREGLGCMMASTADVAASASAQDLRPRARALSWMASLAVAAGELRAAEGYLLELLAWCAFGEREPSETSADSEL